MTEKKIAICLATYNGENYLEDLILSILAQSYRSFVLYIRDDGSTDETLTIILRFTASFPDHVKVITDNREAHSAALNFKYLHEYVRDNFDFDYMMFCDQDDVWLPDKIEISLREMQLLEKKTQGPILLHTDAVVVNHELEMIAKSFWNYRSLNPKRHDVASLLVQNNALGCTMMMNRSLCHEIIYPEELYMHDWWVMLTASALGTVSFIRYPSILYRQHTSNVTSISEVSSPVYVFNKLRALDRVYESIRITYIQAYNFYNIYYDKLDSTNRTVIKKYIDNDQNRGLARRVTLFQAKFLRQGFVQIAGQLIFDKRKVL